MISPQAGMWRVRRREGEQQDDAEREHHVRQRWFQCSLHTHIDMVCENVGPCDLLYLKARRRQSKEQLLKHGSLPFLTASGVTVSPVHGLARETALKMASAVTDRD